MDPKYKDMVSIRFLKKNPILRIGLYDYYFLKLILISPSTFEKLILVGTLVSISVVQYLISKSFNGSSNKS